MAGFLDPLCITEIDDSIFEVCDHEFRYKSDVACRMFTVPVGFHTDFASVPRLGIVYAMLGDTAHEPAVVHDWLYYAGIIPRKMADEVLLEAMESIGIPAWRKWPIYWGVRVGGWHAWDQHRRDANPAAGQFKDSPDIKNSL